MKRRTARGRSRKLPTLDPFASARAAHLRYVDDSGPGFGRVRHGKGFRYLDVDGKPLRDSAHLERIRHLVIPPAWTKVWICPSPTGHLQATGRDARGRKQYRYHPRFREVRDENKYERMLAFAEALPKLRAAVAERLKAPALSREKVLATVVRLLEVTLIRVGNEEYARQNGSFGLTTLREEHVEVEGGVIHFHFRGKSGVEHTLDIRDRRLARIVQRCQELPGEQLFQYLDEDGELRTVEASDVNATIRELSGADFSAKDFRTWNGTVLAACALLELSAAETATALKKNIVAAIKQVAKRLGNTVAVCRRCYVHPVIFEAYESGVLHTTFPRKASEGAREILAELTPEEAAVLALLRKHTALCAAA